MRDVRQDVLDAEARSGMSAQRIDISLTIAGGKDAVTLALLRHPAFKNSVYKKSIPGTPWYSLATVWVDNPVVTVSKAHRTSVKRFSTRTVHRI